MTPSLNAMPATQQAPKQPNYAAKDTARDAARESRNHAKASSKEDTTIKTEKTDEAEQTESPLFEEMMASLLLIQSPAQPAQPPVVTGNGNTTVSKTETITQSKFGAAFNMDPAMLVLPQDASGQALIAESQTSFSDELLAALTPGIPAIPAGETPAVPFATLAADTQVSVPTPVLEADVPVTQALTIPADASADPRLVATGLDPAQMQILKDKISATPANAQSANSSAALSTVPREAGIITVTISPEKPVAPPIQAPQISNPVASVVAMTSGELQSAASEAGVTMDMVADANVDIGADISTSGETASADFDPVEFRIAQSFQRPVAPPSVAASSAPANPQTASPQQGDVAAKAANSNVASHASANQSGKTSAGSSNLGASLSASGNTTAGTTSFDSLITTPAGLPVSTAGALTSPIVQNVSATQSSPAVQTVAAVIARNAAKSEGSQTISLRLDPPELGKLQVQMKYKKGDPLKVHVVLEKSDTASMFQRDAHALESALNNAGLQTDGSSLSFELAQDGNAFNQAMGQESSGGQNGSNSSQQASAEPLPIETSMDIYTDNRTGLTHYNLRV